MFSGGIALATWFFGHPTTQRNRQTNNFDRTIGGSQLLNTTRLRIAGCR
jgi:hypothetical protein